MSYKKKLQTDGLNVESQSADRTHTIVIGNAEKFVQRLNSLADGQKRPEVIKRATIVESRRLQVVYTVESSGGTDTNNKKCGAPVHPDLIAAFKNLNEHLGSLCFQPISEHNPAHKDNKDLPALICPIHCTGFAISGSDDKEAVTLTGYRTLPNAKTIDLQSPSQLYDGDIYEYERTDELSESVAACVG